MSRCLVSLMILTWPCFTNAQEPSPQDRLAFDVASVKQNRSGFPPEGDMPKSNFPLGPGAVYSPNGGFFSAVNQPLSIYIQFAYKLMANQMQFLLPQLPAWVTEERFDIQARAQGNPTKDQMRLMMRSLLADRFKLAIHNETRQVPVFALVLAKPGQIGPKLRPHPNDASCQTGPQTATAGDSAPAPPASVPDDFPELCGGLFRMPASAPGRSRWAARNVALGLIAGAMATLGELGRPVLDETGLSGTFDFSMEWAPDLTGPNPPGGDGQVVAVFHGGDPQLPGLTFQEALKMQLGLKLESKKGPVETIVLDHVEHPSEN